MFLMVRFTWKTKHCDTKTNLILKMIDNPVKFYSAIICGVNLQDRGRIVRLLIGIVWPLRSVKLDANGSCNRLICHSSSVVYIRNVGLKRTWSNFSILLNILFGDMANIFQFYLFRFEQSKWRFPQMSKVKSHEPKISLWRLLCARKSVLIAPPAKRHKIKCETKANRRDGQHQQNKNFQKHR